MIGKGKNTMALGKSEQDEAYRTTPDDNRPETVQNYLNQLPEERRHALEQVRKVILDNLPEGYEETMQNGMIVYVVPLSRYPTGYLGKKDVPLPFAALASQKHHMAVYLTNIYADRDPEMEQWFKQAYRASGKKMDVGKSCIRFRKLEDLPLNVIGQAVAKTPVDLFIQKYEGSRKKK